MIIGLVGFNCMLGDNGVLVFSVMLLVLLVLIDDIIGVLVVVLVSNEYCL